LASTTPFSNTQQGKGSLQHSDEASGHVQHYRLHRNTNGITLQEWRNYAPAPDRSSALAAASLAALPVAGVEKGITAPCMA
jgi:hypothetical protein